MTPIVPKTIFNAEKSDYTSIKPIFQQDLGLMDTINKHHPKNWELFKTLKSLDWDENEFDYSICNQQFKTCDPSIYNRMIKTIAWQWETDSIISRVVPLVISSINMASDLFTGYIRICDNEGVHGATYSEIVRLSFDDPDKAMAEILAVKEALSRLEIVSKVFEEAKEVALEFALTGEYPTQEQYNKIFMFFVALYVVERVQFMASFAITFSICQSTGLFQPAGTAIQKIAQDEYEIHVPYQMEMINALRATPEGATAYAQCKGKIKDLVEEVIKSELSWNDYTFGSDDDEMVGVTREMIDQWIFFNATDAVMFLEIEDDYEFDILHDNPLKFMNDWLKISQIQRSPQEEDNGAYKVNVIRRDDDGIVFDL